MKMAANNVFERTGASLGVRPLKVRHECNRGQTTVFIVLKPETVVCPLLLT
jgi:hypothetical protein